MESIVVWLLLRHRRLEVDLSVQFLPDGEMAVEVVSPFIDMTVGPGKWTVGPAEGSSRRRTNKSSGQQNEVACLKVTLAVSLSFVI